MFDFKLRIRKVLILEWALYKFLLKSTFARNYILRVM